jgi:hypothetical protein
MNFYDFLEEPEPEPEIKFVKIKTSHLKKLLDGMFKLFR